MLHDNKLNIWQIINLNSTDSRHVESQIFVFNVKLDPGKI